MPKLKPPTSEDVDRFGELTFRRYEGIIQTALTQHPKTVWVPCVEFSPETISHRLRDAAKAYYVKRWPSVINYEMFLEIWPKLTIAKAMYRGEVAVKIFDSDAVKNAAKEAINSFKSDDKLVLEIPDINCVKALLFLVARNCFRGKAFTATTTSTDVHSYLAGDALSDFPNAAIRRQDETTYTIV